MGNKMTKKHDLTVVTNTIDVGAKISKIAQEEALPPIGAISSRTIKNITICINKRNEIGHNCLRCHIHLTC